MCILKHLILHLKTVAMIKHLLLFLLYASTAVAQTSLTDARENDSNGYPVLDGTVMTVEGLVINPNQRPGGLTFAIFDVDENIGLAVFSLDDDLGYTPTPGDFVEIAGTLGQFRGLCQIVPTSINVISENNPLPAPTPITSLDEMTESALVVFEDATFVDESEWTNSGSGFNASMTNGTNTITMRIDADVDIYDMEIPTGTFDIIGVGGQFDQDDPLFDGYQLLPRSSADIQPYIPAGLVYTPLSIPAAKETDSDGATTRDNEAVQVSGVIHGINFRPSGLQFTIIDENANGIGVFSFDDQLGLDFAEGNAISIDGRIDQFAGLIQIVPDAITVLSENEALIQALPVAAPNESTESAHISVELASAVDETQWLGDGSSFNVQFLNAAGDTILARVDNDSPVSMQNPPNFGTSGSVLLIGIGGQFDTSAPFDEGYQIVVLDLLTSLSAQDVLNKYDIEIYPNPVMNLLRINSEKKLSNITMLDLQGKKIGQFADQQNVNLSHLNPGQYLLKFSVDKEHVVVPIIKN